MIAKTEMIVSVRPMHEQRQDHRIGPDRDEAPAELARLAADARGGDRRERSPPTAAARSPFPRRNICAPRRDRRSSRPWSSPRGGRNSRSCRAPPSGSRSAAASARRGRSSVITSAVSTITSAAQLHQRTRRPNSRSTSGAMIRMSPRISSWMNGMLRRSGMVKDSGTVNSTSAVPRPEQQRIARRHRHARAGERSRALASRCQPDHQMKR